MINIVVIDDHAIVRDGISALVKAYASDMRIVAAYGCGFEAIECAAADDPDIYIVDYAMPKLNGLLAISNIKKKVAHAKFIIFSMHEEDKIVKMALNLGVKGYITKYDSSQEILRSIREVYAGRTYLSPGISTKVLDSLVKNRYNNYAISVLSRREEEVLQLIAEGYSSKEIASNFGISVNTVVVHRKNIMHKLNTNRQAELVRYAIKEGISNI